MQKGKSLQILEPNMMRIFSLAFAILLIFAPTVEAAQKKTFRAVKTWQQSGLSGWALDRINQKSTTLDGITILSASRGNGITVYVIDSGVGQDDCYGHGTVVASMIAGQQYGIADAAEVVSVKALDCNGYGTEQAVADAVNWVRLNADPDTSVVNMSLGGPVSTVVDTAVSRLAALMPVVAAAGNSSTSACNMSPARVPAAITVAAFDQYNSRSIFSNFGSCVDIWAPGSAIDGIDMSGKRVQWSGTSMAAALVSGSIAYIADRDKTTTLEAAQTLQLQASRPYFLDARLNGRAAYAVWIRD